MRKFVLLTVLSVIAAAFTSCVKGDNPGNDRPDSGKESLWVSQSYIEFERTAASPVVVSCTNRDTWWIAGISESADNSAWTELFAADKQEEGKAVNGVWFSCMVPSAEGHRNELNIGVSPNDTGAPRYLKITMKSGSLSIDLTVKQK